MSDETTTIVIPADRVEWLKRLPAVEPGFCQCGCGQRTTIAERNFNRIGLKKGDYRRFIHNHHKGSLKTGTIVNSDGYRLIYCPAHPNAREFGYVYEHVFIAAKVLGGAVPDGVEVHHYDKNKQHNANTNLVICEDHAYHMLLHVRTEAWIVCGNPDFRKCKRCKKYDDPANLSGGAFGSPFHVACNNAYRRNLRAERAL